MSGLRAGSFGIWVWGSITIVFYGRYLFLSRKYSIFALFVIFMFVIFVQKMLDVAYVPHKSETKIENEKCSSITQI